MRFIPLDKLINMREGYRREFKIDFHRLMLLQHEGEHYIIEAMCPHLEHPLAEAWLEDGEIMCPAHGYRFSLLTGRLIEASRDQCRPLKTWPVVYEGNEIGLDWEEG